MFPRPRPGPAKVAAISRLTPRSACHCRMLWGLPTAVSAASAFVRRGGQERRASPELNTADSPYRSTLIGCAITNRCIPNLLHSDQWLQRARHAPALSPTGQSAPRKGTAHARRCSVAFRGSDTWQGPLASSAPPFSAAKRCYHDVSEFSSSKYRVNPPTAIRRALQPQQCDQLHRR